MRTDCCWVLLGGPRASLEVGGLTTQCAPTVSLPAADVLPQTAGGSACRSGVRQEGPVQATRTVFLSDFDIWGRGGKEEGSCIEKPLSCLALGMGWKMLMLIGFESSPS